MSGGSINIDIRPTLSSKRASTLRSTRNFRRWETTISMARCTSRASPCISTTLSSDNAHRGKSSAPHHPSSRHTFSSSQSKFTSLIPHLVTDKIHLLMIKQSSKFDSTFNSHYRTLPSPISYNFYAASVWVDESPARTAFSVAIRTQRKKTSFVCIRVIDFVDWTEIKLNQDISWNS
jgi:hypothetical protein